MKIKCREYEFFKTKIHYLGFFVGTNGVQPLPEKVAAIKALEPPTDISELRQFLGLVGIYMKFMPFFMDVKACLNTMVRNGAVFKLIEQCSDAFKLIKSDVVKMPT